MKELFAEALFKMIVNYKKNVDIRLNFEKKSKA
eukprot:CAMPEP_0170550620 /NCGR_PEP_ID=MMETSP0211-20121228/8651_1 /TAXON_ID=311385 /ORGANISM="Pseudokeronopsis sp., Strain OXSARD2" /LENGTH=32 /DNA_ID= /DNA_START= /DNA_END= /DNA_ORIENTATION=